jgi:hypothetical protein
MSFKDIEIFFHDFFHFYVDFRKIMAEKAVKNMCLFDFFSKFWEILQLSFTFPSIFSKDIL